jgi:hypothetical protein
MKYVCIVCLILLFEYDLHAQTATIKILPAIQTIGIDSSADITVKLEDIQDLHAYSIEVSYDPSLIRYQSIARLNFLSGWQTFFYPFIDTINGKIRVDEAILGPYVQSGSGEIFKIAFKGRSEGDCSLSLTTSELRNLNNQSIASTLSNAVIQIRLVVKIFDEGSENELMPKIYIYPNPFNLTTTIQFNMESNGIVALKIYNIKGEEVFNQNFNSVQGKGTLTWNGRDINGCTLASGIFFIRVESQNNILIKKVVLLK